MLNPKNIILALIDQLPLKRFYHNFFVTGNAKGLFHPRSHLTSTGNPKVGLNTKVKARAVADKLGEKHGTYFSVYRCMWCGKYHLGKNRDNKKDE